MEENIYFKGLDKKLEDDCYVKTFICSLGYPVVRVEKIKNDIEESQLEIYYEGDNVISALNGASNQVVNEIEGNTDRVVYCPRTFLDQVVESGYNLYFFRLSNHQVLSTICVKGCKDIPVKSVITDTVKEGFLTLEASLARFNLENNGDLNFDRFSEEQSEDVYQYQQRLLKKR